MVKLDMNPGRLCYDEFLKACPAANQFSSNYQRLYVNGQLCEAGQGRIMDPSSDVADWMVAHKNATEMCLVSLLHRFSTLSVIANYILKMKLFFGINLLVCNP